MKESIFREGDPQMEHLFSIEQKVATGEPLTRQELRFLYGVDVSAEDSNSGANSRIVELRRYRDLDEDLLVLFDCTRDEIARSPDQINESTKVYVGELAPRVFRGMLEGVEYVYTKFPEFRVPRPMIVEIGGKDERELKDLLKQGGYEIYAAAEQEMEKEYFEKSLREPNPEETDWRKWKIRSPEKVVIVFFSVGNLGLRAAPAFKLFDRAKELGLAFCPSESALRLRLQYKEQSPREVVYVPLDPSLDPEKGLNRTNYLLLEEVDSIRWLGWWSKSLESFGEHDLFAFCLEGAPESLRDKEPEDGLES